MGSIRAIAIMISAAALLLAGCALYTQTSFTEYRGPSEFTGRGGTVKNVEGIDVWTFGEPDRRFKVLGMIDQSHYNNRSVMSLIAGAVKDSEIVAIAKKYGGDAIIFMGADSVVTGYSTSGYVSGQAVGGYSSGYGTAYTHANRQTNTRVLVIKYLD
jgi:hypothetical protein